MFDISIISTNFELLIINNRPLPQQQHFFLAGITSKIKDMSNTISQFYPDEVESKSRAQKLLEKCKQRDLELKKVCVRVNRNTVVLVKPEKI